MDRYAYDGDVDALFFEKEEYSYDYSLEITSEIVLDLNVNHNVIGLEVLDASKVLGVDTSFLNDSERITAVIVVADNIMCISFTFILAGVVERVDFRISSLYNSTLN
ncbi:MAG: hypothetical protein BZ136_07675 [Methanosphaera sp. rholeuAM74]|nr:MAG: hypothetical protein BZ136_07675 [Methanosphaera sp. rholeuAM74]